MADILFEVDEIVIICDMLVIVMKVVNDCFVVCFYLFWEVVLDQFL